MKNLMKKSVVSAVVVLVAVSLASAGPAFTGPATVAPGQTITVSLTGDNATSMTLENIIDSASVMGAASNPVLSDGWTWDAFDGIGDIVNAGGVLIKNATGTVAFMDPAISGTLYSFDYTAAAGVPIGEQFQIGPGAGTNKVSGGIPAALSLTVVPEPMTIALLGLGGLFLRRKK